MLTIRHNRCWYEPTLPHLVFIDGLYAGQLQNDCLQIDAPEGTYSLRVQFGGRMPVGKKGCTIDLSVSSTVQIDVPRQGDVVCMFHDRERLWNFLFDIDLIAWIVSLFVTMPPLYKIISDTFFAIWLLRIVLIRKRYYKIIIKH